MAGEMTAADVTPEEFPLHFAVAQALGGTVKPFDVYQGPYVLIGAEIRGEGVYAPLGPTTGARLWLCVDGYGQGEVYWYNEATEAKSEPFWPYWKDDEMAAAQAVSAAREVV